MHQSISNFHIGGSPNLVLLVTRTEKAPLTEKLDQLEAISRQLVDGQTIEISVNFQAVANWLKEWLVGEPYSKKNIEKNERKDWHRLGKKRNGGAERKTKGSWKSELLKWK